MHIGEADTSGFVVRRLLSAQFPQWAELPIEPVTPLGTDNAMYRLGDHMVVRLPRIEGAVKPLLKEREWLPRLAPQLPLAVPLPLANGEPDGGYEFQWSIYRWLDGEPAARDRIADPLQAAADLSEFVRALQGIDVADGPRATSDSSRGVPLARRDAATRTAIASLGDSIDADAVTSIWERALCAPDWTLPPVWVHGDLDSRNLLVTNGRLSGVIDFGCLTVGDPASDVMVAWKLFSGHSRDAFRAALSVDEATWARSRGWALSQALIALAYYTLETNAVLVRECLHWLAEVLADGGA